MPCGEDGPFKTSKGDCFCLADPGVATQTATVNCGKMSSDAEKPRSKGLGTRCRSRDRPRAPRRVCRGLPCTRPRTLRATRGESKQQRSSQEPVSSYALAPQKPFHSCLLPLPRRRSQPAAGHGSCGQVPCHARSLAPQEATVFTATVFLSWPSAALSRRAMRTSSTP
jgi:hypothetical protein